MQRFIRRSGLVAALMAAPLIAGCSALGIPDTASGLDLTDTTGLVDPAATSVPLPSPVEISSNDGYSLTLPAGWIGARTNNVATRSVMDAIAAGDPLLGTEARALFDDSDADLSMVAVDTAEIDLVPVPSVMAIMLIPSRRGADDTERRVDAMLGNLTTLTSEVDRSVTSVRAGDADRYDLTVSGDLLTVQLRMYLFTVGDDGIIVLFGSDPAFAVGAASDMEAIVKSLRFGV